MNGQKILKHGLLSAVFSTSLSLGAVLPAHAATLDPSMVGTWTLVAADVLHPDGSRARDYGAAPKGMLVIDAQGHYSLQIFKAERPRFASDDKSAATPAEYKAAVMGSSTASISGANPSTAATSPGLDSAKSRSESMQIFRKLSSL